MADNTATLYAVNEESTQQPTSKPKPERKKLPRQQSLADRWGGSLVEGDSDKVETLGERVNIFFANTTAHGLPRAFEETSSPPRRICWVTCVLLGLLAWIVLCSGTIQGYLEDQTSYQTIATVNSKLPTFPAVTVCPSVPARCDCALWYSDLVLDNLQFTYPLLNFQCPEVLETAMLFADGKNAQGGLDLNSEDIPAEEHPSEFFVSPDTNPTVNFQTDSDKKMKNVAAAIRRYKQQVADAKSEEMKDFAERIYTSCFSFIVLILFFK